MKCPKCGYREETRTEQQNRMLWAGAYLPIALHLSEESGKVITKDMVHAVAKDRFLDPIVVEFNGKVKRYPGSTTRLGVKAFNEYLEKVFAWGVDMGVYFDKVAA